MAIGFPTKANWTAGDVLTASAQDDLAGTLNLLSNASAAGGTQLLSNAAGTSFAYQPVMAGGKNFLINGGFDIWARGISFSAPNAYTADRWYAAANGTWTQDTTLLATGQQYSLKATTTASQALAVYQAIETKNSIPLAGQTVTFSFYLAASTASTVYATLDYSTATDVSPTGSWTNISTNTVSVTTQMVRSTITAIVPSTAKSVRVSYYTGTLASGVSIYIGANQLEIGSVATAFSRAGGTFQGELAACQRYYVRFNASNTYAPFGVGISTSTTVAAIYVTFPTTMRVAPTTSDYSTLVISDIGSYNLAISSLVLSNSTTDSTELGCTNAATAVAFRTAFIRANNSSSAYLAFGAEL
jgi:hypothetical protein